MDILDHLTEEHRKVEDLIDQLKETDAGETRESLLDELTESLKTHMAVEERFVYPLSAAHGDEEDAEEGTDEHDLIRTALAEVHDRVEEGAFGAALEVLEKGISHHVDDEENETFPTLRERAGDELDRLDPEELEQKVKSDGGVDGGGGGGQEPTRDELYEKAQEQDVEGRSSMNKAELEDAVGES